MIFDAIRQSLRLKLILASITIEVIMLTLLLGNSLRIINSSIDTQLIIKKESITPLLDSALSIPLFQRDPATLNELLDKLINSTKSEFTYIKVYDFQGKIFSEKSQSDQNDIANGINNILHVSAPLTIANERIGEVKYGLSVQSLHDSKNTLLTQGVLIALFEIILTIFLLSSVGYFLTRHITVLLRCAEDISSGNYDVNIPIKSKDEIGLLANEFNSMSTAIKYRIEQLSETTNALTIKTAEFESIFNSMVDGVIFVNTDRICVSINPAILTMFNYPMDKFINKKLDFLYLHKHEYENQNAIRFSKSAPDRTDSFEASFIRSDGSVFIGELLATRVKDKHGTVLGFIGILRDISDRKQQEEQLRRSLKMDALGKLTGGIAHDYNNMLGVVLGYAELLELSLKDQPEEMSYLHEINQAGKRGVNLTKKLLSFSKEKSSNSEAIDLTKTILDEKDMLEKTLTSRIQLKFDLAKDLWPIYVDKSDLVDAIINLSINAMHAIKETGTLTFKTVNESISEDSAKLLHLKETDYVLLSIADTGCGITDEEKEKIFEPFYSTKGEMGTGLGLSQVYGFIQRCDGYIKVYSEPGHGTKMTLYFPKYNNILKADIPDKRNMLDEKISERLLGSETILVVDDEPALLSFTKNVLSRFGYHVLTANNAKEALNILNNTIIDLMITDIIMPKMDGYELSEVVQKKYPNIKIQLMSGYNDNRHRKCTDETLEKNLLHKPFESAKLLQCIRNLLSST